MHDAKRNGIDWDEYAGHPEEYQTCWACKNAHDSVMTESKATTKSALLRLSAVASLLYFLSQCASQFLYLRLY